MGTEIDDIIINSGDSTLCEVWYNNCHLFVKLKLYEDSSEVILKIITNEISINESVCNEDPLIRTCFIEIIDIENYLEIKNSHYLPPIEFNKLMKLTRMNLQLAFGKKASKYKKLFSLKGYEYLLTCLIEDFSSISVQK